jgi:hypothetical protein
MTRADKQLIYQSIRTEDLPRTDFHRRLTARCDEARLDPRGE